MAVCDFCHREIQTYPYNCNGCDGTFCPKHRLPEKHYCENPQAAASMLDPTTRKNRRGVLYLILGVILGGVGIGVLDKETLSQIGSAANVTIPEASPATEAPWDQFVGVGGVRGLRWINNSETLRLWLAEDHTIDALALYHEYDETGGLEDTSIWSMGGIGSDVPQYGGRVDVPIADELKNNYYPTPYFKMLIYSGITFQMDIIGEFVVQLPDEIKSGYLKDR